MATIPYTLTPTDDVNIQKVTWASLANGDVGQAFLGAQWSDRSVQIKGTFGTSGEVTLKGSNDGGTTYATLTDPQGNNLVVTSAKIEQITELVERFRPEVTNGDGSTALTVIMFMRGLVNG